MREGIFDRMRAQDLIGARKDPSLLALQGPTFEPEQIARHKQRYMAPKKACTATGSQSVNTINYHGDLLQ